MESDGRLSATPAILCSLSSRDIAVNAANRILIVVISIPDIWGAPKVHALQTDYESIGLSMRASEYRAAVAVTGLSTADIEQLFEVDLATHQALAAGDLAVPPAVALSLLLMLVTNTNAKSARILVAANHPSRSKAA
ncbi:hypothetical protein BN77_3917 [Rhizobium mesoamericanum STM3625]|uniref:Uncharacterized protein n=2 Tax=Rhizobium mesoamericanum TaxID=1079800 RepID=K0PSN8_9HYPH|nr:hypothetical protein BN77_3917 [Rhizobium mesoamericanum STM3625]